MTELESSEVWSGPPNPAVGFHTGGRKRHDPAWRDVVVVPGDMRRVAGGFDRVDCLVSELLGSFGDNELSPECLDGAAAALLKPCLLYTSPSPRD